jgi:hypothetical protein
VVSTNLDGADTSKLQKSLLKQKLQEEVSRHPDLIGSEDSLGGVMAFPYQPPPVPPVQNQRFKELIDRRKNWVFMSPEELNGDQTIEEVLGVSQFDTGGEKKKRLSAVERFYQRLEQESRLMAGRSAKNVKAGKGSVLKEKDSPMARHLTETEKTLRHIFNANPTGDYLPWVNDQGVGSELFDPADVSSATFESTQTQIDRRKEFLQILEPRLLLESSPNFITPTISQPGLAAQPPSWTAPLAPSAPLPPSAVSPVSSPGLAELPGSKASVPSQPTVAPAVQTEPPRFPQPVTTPPPRKF